MRPFDPDMPLAGRHFTECPHDTGTLGERQLMLAVLRDAVECYQKYAFARDSRGRTEFTNAVEWITSTDRQWPFSYENICDVLGLDAAYLRRGLSRWGRQKAPAAYTPPRIVPLVSRRRRPPSGGGVT